MKFLGTFIYLLWSIAAFGAEAIVCNESNVELSLKVSEISNQKNVSWALKLIQEETVVFQGSGPWQKEPDSEDAFSAYDEQTAVSFKNDRAVFVFPDNKVIVFSDCKKN